MPSNFDEKDAIVFRGQYPGNFETKFFPSRFEGILYNSEMNAHTRMIFGATGASYTNIALISDCYFFGIHILLLTKTNVI